MNNYVPVDQLRINELRDMRDGWAKTLAAQGVETFDFLHLRGIAPFLLYWHGASDTYLHFQVNCGRVRVTWWSPRTDHRMSSENVLLYSALREVLHNSANFR